jgi:NADH:ubiquinone reductase (H+-translocating)
MSQRVVILGGGFGGLYAARALAKAPVKVTLLDRRNHHIFQPLLYQVATAALNPSDIAHPIRSVLSRQRNCEVLLAEVVSVDVPNKQVVLRDGRVDYDFLIVATGATHSYFGKDQWAEAAPGLKTLEDATEIRRRVLYAFEAAERTTDDEARRALLSFVVVGGGATGVEIAGALAELSRHALARDFRHIDPKQARILLIEGGPRILPAYPEDLSASSLDQLKDLGVEVWLNSPVTDISEQGVKAGERSVACRTVIWGAGVKASPLGATLGAPLDRAGRVIVTSNLTLPEHDDVFVIGDLAAAKTEGAPVPGVAGAAVQMGRHAAEAIVRRLAGKAPVDFKYIEKGSLATIGRSRAIAVFPGNIKLRGFIAWWAWLFVHILLLIGFRNRLVVFVQWAWAYFTFQRGARLITGPALDEPASPHSRPDV